LVPNLARLFYFPVWAGLARKTSIILLAGSAKTIMLALCNVLYDAQTGILFLSIGDAAASIGTAAGYIPVGSSPRKVEGSIGCLVICTGLGIFCGLDSIVALTAALLVSFGEILAEVIGLDDNLVIPMLSVLGVRIALSPIVVWQHMLMMMCTGLAIGVMLGAVVGFTSTDKGVSKSDHIVR
jgi:dolichol kinase